jgi:hypothetical protein
MEDHLYGPRRRHHYRQSLVGGDGRRGFRDATLTHLPRRGSIIASTRFRSQSYPKMLSTHSPIRLGSGQDFCSGQALHRSDDVDLTKTRSRCDNEAIIRGKSARRFSMFRLKPAVPGAQ